MFSQLWLHLTPEDHDFNKYISICTISGSFYVNLNFSGPVVLEKKHLNDPNLLLYFCNYLPFEEDLALYLYKVEFPSCKDDLYQV
jgi:hypothetical protein